MAGPGTLTLPEEVGYNSLTERDEQTSNRTSSMAEVLAANETAKQVRKKTAVQIQFCGRNLLPTKGEAAKIARLTIDQTLNRLDERVVNVADKTIAEVLENRNSNVSK